MSVSMAKVKMNWTEKLLFRKCVDGMYFIVQFSQILLTLNFTLHSNLFFNFWDLLALLF